MTIEMTPEGLDAATRSFPAGSRLYMLNLLRYRERAEYGDGPAPWSTGRDAYFKAYVPAFNEISAGMDVRPFWIGNVAGPLVGPPGERWDDMAIVEYPSFETFRRIVLSSEYIAKAAPHRRAALEDLRLIATTKMDMPG